MVEIILFPQKSLITVDVFYFYPDTPNLIQEFLWQTEDIVPELPRIEKFLRYWEANIEGRIHHVILAGIGLDGPKKFSTVDEIFTV